MIEKRRCIKCDGLIFFLKTDEGVIRIISNNNNVIHERRELKVPMGRENIAEGGK